MTENILQHEREEVREEVEVELACQTGAAAAAWEMLGEISTVF